MPEPPDSDRLETTPRPLTMPDPRDPELAVATGLMAQALADDPHRTACVREALATTAGRQALGLGLLAALLDSAHLPDQQVR